jgi:hypothetical protein
LRGPSNKAAEHYAAKRGEVHRQGPTKKMKQETKPSPFATLIDCMKEDGLAAEVKKLDDLLREVAWTTGSEFQGEFGLEMKNIKKSSWNRMNEKTKACFKSVADMILKAWPDIGL